MFGAISITKQASGRFHRRFFQRYVLKTLHRRSVEQ
jgi:hypothetical protein